MKGKKNNVDLDALKGDEAVMDFPAIDKNARRAIWCDKPELMAKDRYGDHGTIEGYAAVWDNVDSQNEIIRRGAFTKSIEENVANGKVKLMVKHFCHGGDVPELIGTVVEAREDDYGLWFRAKLSGVPLAQKVRQLVKEGHVDGASVGYSPIKWNHMSISGKKVVEHVESKLFEITITAIPANTKTTISAKTKKDGEGDATPSVDELLASAESYISSLSLDDSSRLAAEKDRAALLCKSLGDMQGRLSVLLEPQASKVEVTDDRLHSIKMEIERYRLDAEKASLLLN